MAASLRLTLRTLLSYLDDTLDPAEAKLIGQKVAESEQARELMERIKQVTRKRRLTTPPPTGPGGIDANTIAEYLDSEVTPEQAEEVERICLASDVHLAEVAACHQILTLVLGEPALVPPSARQRMYGLVKGPEAIPFRKPPRTKGNADLDLSTSDAGLEGDESMRVSGFMRNASVRNTVLLVGGGVLAACFLVFALYNIFHMGSNRETEQPPAKGPAIAQVDINKDKEEEDRKQAEAKRIADEKKKQEDKQLAEAKQKDAENKVAEAKKKDEQKKPAPVVPAGQEEIPFEPPDVTPVVLGIYHPNAKTPDVTLQREAADKGNWVRLGIKNPKIASVRPLMSLPVSKASIQLNKGLHLTLWGTSPEVWPVPNVYESRVRLYDHPLLDLDMLLERGRVAVKNLRTDGKPAMLRIRFENPQQKKQEAFTIALMDPDAEVIVEHQAGFDPNEPFYEDKSNPTRLGPIVQMHCILQTGSAYFRWAGNLDYLDAKNQRYVTWNSVRGSAVAPQELDPTNPKMDWALPEPKQHVKSRREVMAANARMAMNLQGKQLDVGLQETLESDNPVSQRLALACFTALDDYNKPIDYMDRDDPKLSELRMVSIFALKNWMAQGLDNEYKVYDALEKTYRPVLAKKMMALLHGLGQADAAMPATWQHLIDGLNNDVLPMRELSFWTLAMNAPAAGKVLTRYSAIAPPELRAAVQRELRMLIPPGQLPPQPGGPPPGPAPKKK